MEPSLDNREGPADTDEENPKNNNAHFNTPSSTLEEPIKHPESPKIVPDEVQAMLLPDAEKHQQELLEVEQKTALFRLQKKRVDEEIKLEVRKKEFEKEKKELEAALTKEKKLYEGKRKALDDERRALLTAFEKDRKSFEDERKKIMEALSKDRKALEDEKKKFADSVIEEKKKFADTMVKEKKKMEKELDDIRKVIQKERKQLEDDKKVLEKEKAKVFKELQKQDKKKKKKTKIQDGIVLSEPQGFMQKVHVDIDYKWSGENPNDMFEMQEELGKGAYGAVYKSKHKETNFTLAVKVIAIESGMEEIEKEVEILKKCKNSNIVSYYGTCQVPETKKLWILMDYCGGGSLRTLIETLNKPLSEDQIAFVSLNALKGLAYLHSMNIIHRDVKAANILLTEDGQVKIADFGVSEQLNSKVQKAKDTIGTPLWMAPEVILNKQYDNKCDIWSMGITMIELADGLPPHSQMNPMRAMRMIPNWPSPTLSKPPSFSQELNDFIALCVLKEPSQRPSAVQLLTNPFLVKAKGPEVLTGAIQELVQIMKEKRQEGKSESESERSGSFTKPAGQMSNSEDEGGEIFSTTVVNQEVENDSIKIKFTDEEPSTMDPFATTVVNNQAEVILPEIMKPRIEPNLSNLSQLTITGTQLEQFSKSADELKQTLQNTGTVVDKTIKAEIESMEGKLLSQFTSNLEKVKADMTEHTREILKRELDHMQSELLSALKMALKELPTSIPQKEDTLQPHHHQAPQDPTPMQSKLIAPKESHLKIPELKLSHIHDQSQSRNTSASNSPSLSPHPPNGLKLDNQKQLSAKRPLARQNGTPRVTNNNTLKGNVPNNNGKKALPNKKVTVVKKKNNY